MGKDGEDSISKQRKMEHDVTATDFCFQKITFCNLSLYSMVEVGQLTAYNLLGTEV